MTILIKPKQLRRKTGLTDPQSQAAVNWDYEHVQRPEPDGGQ